MNIPKIKDMHRVYYDAEFTGLQRDADLISIGMVSGVGSLFYAEFNDYNTDKITDWIQTNVINNLLYNHVTSIKEWNPASKNPASTHYSMFMKGNREEVKQELLKWLENESKAMEKDIVFFTDCYAYDWVLLNDLICIDGNALSLPKFINYIPVDLCTHMYMRGIDPDVNREEFIGSAANTITQITPFKNMGEKCKHNSLYDAQVCMMCFAMMDVLKTHPELDKIS